MSFKLIDNHLSPAEGEVTVRTYHCTSLSPVFALIGLQTDGYLTVTNKRVVFFASGSSLFGAAGSSKLYNEVPVADVANLSLSQGTRFSFLRLIGAQVISTIVGGIVFAAQALVLPLLGLHDQSNPYILRLGICLLLFVSIWLFLRSMWFSREDGLRFLLASCGWSVMASIVGYASKHRASLESLPSPYLIGMAILAVMAMCYWIYCLYWFIRREYLTMTISSKSGFVTPIRIVGVSWWGRINIAAEFAAGMAPAVDADIMFKELGAIVTDIQTLGDHGVEKWLRTKPEINTSHKPQDMPCRWPAMRHAVVAMVLIAILIGGESMWYSMTVKKTLALKMRNELADARKMAGNEKSVREWVPKMWDGAEREATEGEKAFQKRQFGAAALHWAEAIKGYANMSNAAVAMKDASAVRSQYDSLAAGVYIQESVSDRLKAGRLMTAFSDLMNQQPSSNENWVAFKTSSAKAFVYAEQDKWDQSRMAWDYAGERLPSAIQLMRAELWVVSAEQAIKKGDTREASGCALNALKEYPLYSRAIQRQELAWNMIKYAQLFISEVKKGSVNATDGEQFAVLLDLQGGADWIDIKNIIERARTSASRNEWEQCNSQWEEAIDKLPEVILAMQMEKVESEARRGNWYLVSVLASNVLTGHPEHRRASTLKTKADSIESARASEEAYRKVFSNSLDREVTSDHVKLGDMSDFIAHMDRYGHEEWAQLKVTIENAGKSRSEERGTDSSNEWVKACVQLPSAVQRMRAEVWIERADQEVQSNNWAKVLIYAGNALKEKPDLIRARQLRDQADEIEAIPVVRMKYEQLFNDASTHMTDLGCSTNDQNALLTNLVQYGGASWKFVEENVAKATEADKQGRRTDCIAAWKLVMDTFPEAIRVTRSGYWLAKAEADASNKLWAKVSIEADRALTEDPKNERAKALKKEAESNSK